MSVSIWEGKPKKRSGSHQYMDFSYYPDKEMDTWLGNLRAYYKLVEEKLKILEAEE